MRTVVSLPTDDLERGIEDIVRRTLPHLDHGIVAANASRDRSGERAAPAKASLFSE